MLYGTFASGGLRGDRLTKEMLRYSLRIYEESMQFFLDDAQRNPRFWGLEERTRP